MTNQDPSTGSFAPEPSNPTPIEPEAGNPEGSQELQLADATPDAATQLRRAEDEALAMKDAYLRARADVENVRRQAQTDLAKAHKYAIERFAEALLPVKDALETALSTANATPETLRDGVELTLKQLVAAFEKAQLTVIDPAGEKFDPHYHQAMAMVESDQPANTVIQVMQKGYRLNDRVLRPALVAVAKADG